MAYTKSNEIKTRIALKYDSLENWSRLNPTLLQGEIAIAHLATSHTSTTPNNGTHPILFKVGPGAFNSLPWTSALAADVYEWAKQETVTVDSTSGALKFGNVKSVDLASFYAKKADLEGLAAEVETIDTNTTYTFTVNETNGDLTIKSKEKGSSTETTIVTVPILTTAELNATLANYVTTDALNTALEDYVDNDTFDAYKSDVEGEFAKYTNTENLNKELAKYTKTENLDTTIDGYGYLKAADIAGKVDQSHLEENYYTKTEIGTIPQNSTVISLIEANAANFDNYDTKSEVNTKISTALEDYYTSGEVDDLIKDLASAMNFIGVKDALPESGVLGDVVIVNQIEYVWDGTGWKELGDQSKLGQVATDLDDLEGEVAELSGTVGGHTSELDRLDKAIQANAKAIADNEQDIEKKVSDLTGTVNGHGTTIGEHTTKIQKNADDIAALPASITISSTEETGKYVSAISGNAKDGFTVSKASLPSVTANVTAGTATNASGNEVTVITAVENDNTAGHAVKLKTTRVAKVATTAGAEAAAASAVTTFAANMVESGTGSVIIGMTKNGKNGNNISFTKGNVDVSTLAQTANTYVLFNCGSASDVM